MAEHTEYVGGGYASSGWPAAARLRARIEDLREQAREETVRLAVDAREEVEAVVRRRQEALADRLAGIAAALRDAGRRLEREAAPAAAGAGFRPLVAGVDDRPAGFAAGSAGSPATAAASSAVPAAPALPAVDAATRGLAELAERAARQVDRASLYLRRSELRDVARDVEDLARRRPAAFVGGSFAAGLVLARIFKGSGERRPFAKLAGRR